MKRVGCPSRDGDSMPAHRMGRKKKGEGENSDLVFTVIFYFLERRLTVEGRKKRNSQSQEGKKKKGSRFSLCSGRKCQWGRKPF